MPSAWNAVEIARRAPNRSIAHSRTSSGSWPSNSTDELAGLELVQQLVRCSCCLLRGRAWARRGLASSRPSSPPSSSSVRRSLEGTEALAVAAARRASRGSSRSTARSRRLARHAAEDRPADRRHPGRGRRAEDVVAGVRACGPRPRTVVALEAEVADPVLGAGVRAAVEVEAQARDVARRTSPRGGGRARAARLRLGDREVAVRLAGAGDRRAPQTSVALEREADLREPGERLVEPRVGERR